MTLPASEAMNVLLGTTFLVYVFVRTAAWLIELEEPKGRHHAGRVYRVQADVDQRTIEIFQAMNRPPAAILAGDDDFEPEWVHLARRWQDETGTFSALIELQDESYTA